MLRYHPQITSNGFFRTENKLFDGINVIELKVSPAIKKMLSTAKKLSEASILEPHEIYEYFDGKMIEICNKAKLLAKHSRTEKNNKKTFLQVEEIQNFLNCDVDDLFLYCSVVKHLNQDNPLISNFFEKLIYLSKL